MNSRRFLMTFGCVALLGFGAPGRIHAQAAKAAAVASPEVAALGKAREAGLARIKTERDAKLVPINTQYAEDLNRLMQDFTKAGNAAGAAAVTMERDQTLDGKAPTAEQRKAMPSRMQFLRASYEKKLKVIDDEAARLRVAEAAKYGAGLEQLKLQATKANDTAKLGEIEGEITRAFLEKGGGQIGLAEVRQFFHVPETWKTADDSLSGHFGNIDKSHTLKSEAFGPARELKFSIKMLSKWYQVIKVHVGDQYFQYSRGHWKNKETCYNNNGKEKHLPGKVDKPDEWATLEAQVKDGKIQFFYNGKMEVETALKPMPPEGFMFIVGFNGNEADMQVKDVMVSTGAGK